LGVVFGGEADPPFDFAQGRLFEDDRKKSKVQKQKQMQMQMQMQKQKQKRMRGSLHCASQVRDASVEMTLLVVG
jgi:hypothetical protein